LLILGFGLPIDSLPDSLEEKEKEKFGVRLYNSTLGSEFFVKKIKPVASVALGGSLRLFTSNTNSFSFDRNPARPELFISASLPDGCTVSQLNEIVLSMENYLSKFEEIESFKTTISSYKSANISVKFKKEIEFTSFPTTLKSNVISKAQDFGGANWVVSGIDERGFNNNINTSYKEHKIRLLGYNYDQLFRYCKELADSLSLNPRIKGADIIGDIGWYSSISSSEYYIDYDVEKMALYGLMPYQTYGVLNDLLYSTSVGAYKYGDEQLYVDVVSSQKNSFDVWNLKNSYIKVANKDVKFSNLGSIEKRSTGNDIFRYNQQYSLYVAFDYIGNYGVLNKIIDKNIENLNSNVLPIGYKAERIGYSGFWDNKKQNIYLIFLVIGIIFFICSVLFESLRYPLIIIGLIPISFIGMFLIFYFTNTSFDQGGFAAMVMLSGLVVNAGIYLLNEFKGQKQIKHYPINVESKIGTVKYYIRAFNHKIIPILLTVLSTLLGLIPFLMDGPKEVFWFAFALGTIGGLVFSLVALILFMPIWIPMKHK
jgi:Cation/multidrug efflux pump